jgi:prepilin peptidase CpaA
VSNLVVGREIALLVLLVVSAYSDLAHGKVYNWCTVPAILGGPLVGYLVGGLDQGAFNLVDSALGLLLAGGIFGLFFLCGAFGAGDLKLAAAIGALKGWQFAAMAIGYSALAGGILALGLLAWRGQLVRGLRDTVLATVRPRHFEKNLAADSPARLTIPYGFAISVGTMWAWYLAEVF